MKQGNCVSPNIRINEKGLMTTNFLKEEPIEQMSEKNLSFTNWSSLDVVCDLVTGC